MGRHATCSSQPTIVIRHSSSSSTSSTQRPGKGSSLQKSTTAALRWLPWPPSSRRTASLVSQFTTGNLNPFIGGYAQKDQGNRTMLRAGQNTSGSLPWAPVPEGLTNNPFGEYVGDVGFDPLGFAKN